MIKAIIIDDEPKSISVLSVLLADYFPDVIFSGSATGIQEGVELIRDADPDLVFLDIQMGKGLGFDLLDQFDTPFFHVVFVTAFGDYAVKAFRYSAIDYLLKPVDVTDLERAVAKVRQRKKNGIVLQEQSPRQPEYVDLGKSNEQWLVHAHQLVFLEASGSYCRVYLSDGKNFLITSHLALLEERLNKDIFLRIHRSHIINVFHIKRVIKNDGVFAELSNGMKAEVSRRNKTEFFNRIRTIGS